MGCRMVCAPCEIGAWLLAGAGGGRASALPPSWRFGGLPVGKIAHQIRPKATRRWLGWVSARYSPQPLRVRRHIGEVDGYLSVRDGFGAAKEAAIGSAARAGRQALMRQRHGNVALTGAGSRFGQGPVDDVALSVAAADPP